MTRTDLIAGLLSSIDGSRELDFWCWWYGRSTESGKADPKPPPEDYVRAALISNDAPRYTRSIEAALTLAPEGAEYSISTLYGVAIVELPLNSDNWQTGRRLDGNVALAICAAAIKARAA